MKSNKLMAFMLTASAVLCTSLLPARAAEADQNSTGGIGTTWTFELKNDPTYTITIPSEVTISKDGTQVSISAENTANLDGKRISVTIAGTNAYKNQMVLEGVTEQGMRKSIRYSITTADNEQIETNLSESAVGKELASFTEDGTIPFTVAPIVAPSSAKGVTYTGSMTYGIELVDAAAEN